MVVRSDKTGSFNPFILLAPYGYDHYGSRGSVGRRSVGKFLPKHSLLCFSMRVSIFVIDSLGNI